MGVGFAPLGFCRRRCRVALKKASAQRQSEADRENFDPGFRQFHPSKVVLPARTARQIDGVLARSAGPFRFQCFI
jgi:hypothetical protein